MSIFIALGISIGVLGGIWGIVCSAIADTILPINPAVTFFAWACFYAAGGNGKEGIKKQLCSNLSGLIYGVLISLVAGVIPAGVIPGLGLGIGLLIFIFCLCAQAKIEALSFIPGSVIGAAIFFVRGANINEVPLIAVAIVCGSVLGYISEAWAKKMAKS